MGRGPPLVQSNLNTCDTLAHNHQDPRPGPAELDLRELNFSSPPPPQYSRHCLRPRVSIVSGAKSGQPPLAQTLCGPRAPRRLSRVFALPSLTEGRQHPMIRPLTLPPSSKAPLPPPPHYPANCLSPCGDLAWPRPHNASQLSHTPPWLSTLASVANKPELAQISGATKGRQRCCSTGKEI